ncbi:MAG: tetratricopeptide repeat protein [Chitinispirillaceae bacterium]|nr:tetratricopeptide repeat protein [Chitinispirillaceae bacterium]
MRNCISAKRRIDAENAVYLSLAGCVACHFLFLFVLPRVFTFPELFGRAWGFHFITYYSVPVIIAFYACTIAACLPWTVRPAVGLFSHPLFQKGKIYLTARKEKAFYLVAVLSIPLFWILNSKYALLGDNFGIAKRTIENTFMPDERGSIFVLHFFYTIAHSLFSADGITAIKLFSNLCGGIFVYLSLRIADATGSSFFEKASIFLFYSSFCTIQHFCGYVEVYAGTIIATTAYLYVSLLCLKGRIHVAVPAAVLAGATIMHSYALMLFPMLIYLLYISWLKKYPLFRQPLTWLVAIVFLGLLSFSPASKAITRHFMPLASPTEMTLFSFVHFWEFLNGQILGCGPALFIAAGCLLYAVVTKIRLTYSLHFIIGSSCFVLAGLFLFRSNLGSADWDIFSLSSLWVNIGAIVLFFHLFKAPEHALFRRRVAVSFIALMILHCAPWILINASDRSIARFKDIIFSDPAYGWNETPWGPNSYRPRICRIAMRMRQNRLEREARDLYQKAYEDDPRQELHLFNYYATLCDEKQAPLAGIILDSLAHIHPLQFLERFKKILSNAQKIRNDILIMKVLNYLYDFFIANPETIQSLFNQKEITGFFRSYAELLLKTNNAQKALQVSRSVVAAEPGDGINHYLLARSYYETGEYDSTIAICTMLNTVFPDKPQPNILRAQAQSMKQSPSKAPLTAVPFAHPTEEASQLKQASIPVDRAAIDAHIALGNRYAEKSHYNKAARHLNEALRLNPSSAIIHFNLANVYSADGRQDEAIPHFKEALRINPALAEAHNNLGNALAETGHIDEAIMHFKKALSLQPGLEQAQKNLERALILKKFGSNMN